MKGVFTVDWNQPAPDGSGKPLIPNEVVHGLIQHFESHDLSNARVPPDILGRAYEYLIKRFADDAGACQNQLASLINVTPVADLDHQNAQLLVGDIAIGAPAQSEGREPALAGSALPKALRLVLGRSQYLLFVRKTTIFSYMKTTPKTAELIRQRIEAMPVGEPFTPTVLLECGTRASVDQNLSRLVKAGMIERVTRGVFVRPEVSRFVGKVMPEPMMVAMTVAKATGAIVQIHGAEAARRLELTTQVPTQSVFVTSGPSKRIRVGKMEIRLQHVCQRKLALAGRPAGLALSAMWYLGKTEVTPALVEKIRRKLGASEFEVLKSATSSMPAWMSDAIFRSERTAAHA